MNLDKFKKVQFKKKKFCSICKHKLSKPLIRFPKLPLTEIYTKKKPSKLTGFVDQDFHICKKCGHGQTSNIISPKLLYGQHTYFFRTSKSSSASQANNIFLTFIDKIIGERVFNSILEFGCSDLYLLKKLTSKAKKLFGIDPVLKGKHSANKISIVGDFIENIIFENELKLNNSLVLSSHTMEHMENPKTVFKRLIANASNDTIFVHQFPSLEGLIDDMRFDQIFHQHLQYYSLNSVKYLLNELGAELIDYEFNPAHWNSLLIAFKKSNKTNANMISKKELSLYGPKRTLEQFEMFKQVMSSVKEQISLVKGNIYCFGATLMLPILGYHIKSNFSFVKAILDDDPNKSGLYYINLTPKIIKTTSVKDINDAVIIFTVLNSARGALTKVIELNPKKIIIPINIV